MATLFISDLHLDATRPDTTRQFLGFLDTVARAQQRSTSSATCSRPGSATTTPIRPACDRRCVACLYAVGVPCRVMHGNRDFLLGRRFEQDTGTQIIADGTRIELGNERVC
jgi:UDP-2,3-diacylglucosamine hydrolase